MHLETSNFVPKSRFRIFRHGQSIALSTKHLLLVVVDSSTVELVDDTYTTISVKKLNSLKHLVRTTVAASHN